MPATGGSATDRPAGADMDETLIAELRQRDRERWLSILWAPAAARPALLAIHAFDAEQQRIVADAKEPMMAEIRLAWWREQMCAVADGAAAPAQPILQALARDARTRGVDVGALSLVEEGHLPLLRDGALDPEAAAARRGAPLFVALAQAITGGALCAAGEAAARDGGAVWALAQLARWHGISGVLPRRQILGPLPGSLRGLVRLAEADVEAASHGRLLPPVATAGRQWTLARHAVADTDSWWPR